MKVGILSDTHDRLPAIDAAIAEFLRLGIEAVIHAGDIVAPFAAQRLLMWKGPLYVVYGNNDGERRGLQNRLPQIQDGPLVFELGGRRILVHHDLHRCRPSDMRGVDIIVTGHTHEPVNAARAGRLYVNPGECCGWVTGRCTVALLDTDGPLAEIIELKP